MAFKKATNIASVVLLLISFVLIVVCLTEGDITTSGIATVKFEIPLGLRRRGFVIPDLSEEIDLPQFPDVTGLPDIPDQVQSIASDIATRVSDGISQATGLVDSLLGDVPDELSIGTRMICLKARDGEADCRAVSSTTSFPSSVDTFLDLRSITSPIRHIRSSLVAALVGVILLVLIKATFSIERLGRINKLGSLFRWRGWVEGVGTALVLVPLLVAALWTYVMRRVLGILSFLAVQNGKLFGCLVAAVVLVLFSAVNLVAQRLWREERTGPRGTFAGSSRRPTISRPQTSRGPPDHLDT